MQEEKPRRKPRVPLSPEELYYFKKIKELNQQKKIDDFKLTLFYKFFNTINVALAAFLSYGVLSILICCKWQTAYVLDARCSYSNYDSDVKKMAISQIEFTTTAKEFIPVKTSNIYNEPEFNEVLYLGRDLIFNKVLKVKLANNNQSFWHIYMYPAITVSVFALCIGFFVYKLNRHLSVNGLLTVFGLFILASLYFVLI